MSDETRHFLEGERIATRTIPNTASLPLHPPVHAAELAVMDIMRKDFRVSNEDARRRVRVEITREVEMEMRSLVSANNPYLTHDPRRQPGPLQIMGVSYYVVDKLPDPGWRVLP